MAITAYQLTQALQSLGPARVFVGNAFSTGGLIPVGATEGPPRLNMPMLANELTAIELTGEVPHSATYTPGRVTLTVPIIAGADSFWELISPVNSQGIGWNSPQAGQSTNLLLVPFGEMKTSVDPPTLSYDGATWDPGAPVNAIWIWKAVPAFDGEIPFPYENGGKSIVDVTWVAHFDATKPSGQKVVTIGNPATQGITTIRL